MVKETALKGQFDEPSRSQIENDQIFFTTGLKIGVCGFSVQLRVSPSVRSSILLLRMASVRNRRSAAAALVRLMTVRGLLVPMTSTVGRVISSGRSSRRGRRILLGTTSWGRIVALGMLGMLGMLVRCTAELASVGFSIRITLMTRWLKLWLLSRRRGEILLSMLSLLGWTSWRGRRERVVVRQMRAPSERVSAILLMRTRLLLMASVGGTGAVLLLMRAVLRLGWARMLLATILLAASRLLLVRIVGLVGALLLVRSIRLTLSGLRAMLLVMARRRRAIRMRSSSRGC